MKNHLHHHHLCHCHETFDSQLYEHEQLSILVKPQNNSHMKSSHKTKTQNNQIKLAPLNSLFNKQEGKMNSSNYCHQHRHQHRRHCQHLKQQHKITANHSSIRSLPLLLPCILSSLLFLLLSSTQLVQSATSAIRFDPETNSYSGLTFTFDPRLDNKRVEWLHFEHWLSIMQQSSGLLYEALNGRAHLAEVRVLIPYKWRHNEWSILHKPGVPIIMNRRLLYSNSDVIVGFEDPIYKETPFAVQHDECSRPGLNIRMPVSFLEQNQQSIDVKLKARQLIREFASHRYGIFKESGFRYDPMYPPFSSLAGLSNGNYNSTSFMRQQQHQHRLTARAAYMAGTDLHSNAIGNENQSNSAATELNIRGFDENWQECSFETNPASGLPTQSSMNCVPYLCKPSATDNNLPSSSTSASAPVQSPPSLNLMSTDPFSYGDVSSATGSSGRVGAGSVIAKLSNQVQPVEWRDLAESTKWHFCGDNFPPTQYPSGSELLSSLSAGTRLSSGTAAAASANEQLKGSIKSFPHNQLTTNKQNIMCQERSSMEVIKASEDFRRNTFSPSTFNRLPATTFKFMQEMPPRIILCVEYAAHLYQSRRLDHGILDSAINKFLAYDLIADSELALVLFGQEASRRNYFKKLDQSVNSRLTLYSPPIDPFDEIPKIYSQDELAQLDIQAAHSQVAKLIKGTCSFSKVILEVLALQQQRHHYDDIGTDIIIVTTGLFIEDESKIEDLIKQWTINNSGNSNKLENLQFNLIIYPSTMLFDTKSRDGFVVLDSIESDLIIKNRLSKLQLIQRLLNAKIHFIREHLDSNGDVKMSTLLQFYQVFEHISKGHSWDQTNSMITLSQQTIESTPHASNSNNNNKNGNMESTMSNGNNKLTFQFEMDGSLQNSELIVGFIDPKHRGQQQQRSGKRFSIKNLQLRSPGGHIILTDSHPFPILQHHHQQLNNNNNLLAQQVRSSNNQHDPVQNDASDSSELGAQFANLEHPAQDNTAELVNNIGSTSTTIESALFPYRSQLNLAGFHLKPSHLNQLIPSFNNNSIKLAGLWTLTASSDEAIQTNGVAMAQVDPNGDTIIANCWIQTYYDNEFSNSPDSSSQSSADNGQNQKSPLNALKSVKVFAQVKGGPSMGFVEDVQARLEIQDDLGNIVQNVNMLDDGLGSPDMTQGDGILSQYVHRAQRPGYYKATIELSSSSSSSLASQYHQYNQKSSRLSSSNNYQTTGASSQDNACCGSSIPAAQNKQQQDTRYLNRQLYCGTFYVDGNNKLAQQRPPRVNNLTVANVDQDNRRVTIRWFEPSLDIFNHHHHHNPNQILSGSKLANLIAPSTENTNDVSASLIPSPAALVSISLERLKVRSAGQKSSRVPANNFRTNNQQLDNSMIDSSLEDVEMMFDNQGSSSWLPSSQQAKSSSTPRGVIYQQQQQNSLSPLTNRYEIKLFTDRDLIKRAFDSKHEYGFKFNDINIDGIFMNSTTYGGMKELTLRVPLKQEGIYYIAMKVYNNNGLGSQMSNIIQFYLKNNLTSEELQTLYGQATTIDSEGNVYDKNGELIQRGAGNNGGVFSNSYSLLRGATMGSNGSNTLEGITVLIFFIIMALFFSIVCIFLIVCLTNSIKKSMLGKKFNHDDNNNNNNGIGSGGQKLEKNKKNNKTLGMASSTMGIVSNTDGSGCSSMVSGGSGCGSSQQSEVASSSASSTTASAAGSDISQGGHDVEIMNKLSLAGGVNSCVDNTIDLEQANANFNHIQKTHQHQQQQSQLIHNQLMNNQQQYGVNQQQQYKQQQQQQWLPQHTMVNGYAYATVMQQQQLNLNLNSPKLNVPLVGDLNQNGLGGALTSPVQSWPADILLSHYDKVKQARERNEAPPVMRIENLENQHHAQCFNDATGLPIIEDDDDVDGLDGTRTAHSNGVDNQNNSYLVRQQRNQMPSYFNQQLQQQLNSVLKSKQQQRNQQSTNELQVSNTKTSPALEGLTDQQFVDNQSYLEQQTMALPPPQYIYSTGSNTTNTTNTNTTSQDLGISNHHQTLMMQQHQPIIEPSIYSHVTNLQQVNSNSSMLNSDLGHHHEQLSYYTNQEPWQVQQQQQGLIDEQQIYSTSQTYHLQSNETSQYSPNNSTSDILQNNRQQQQQFQDAQSNSAISEV